MTAPIYLDYNATTPVDPQVFAAMEPYFSKFFGNPASNHPQGWKAKEAVERAREQIARLINAENPDCIIFTSSATESNNLALKGLAHFQKSRLNSANSPQLLSQQTEHSSVLEPLRELEREGFKLTLLACDRHGHVTSKAFADAINENTILVSLMQANNEIGTIMPIAEVGKLCREKNITLHCDAVQSAGKIPVDVQADQIDLLTLSGHKLYGPKGIGALYISNRRPQIRLQPEIVGGGHERGLRSGTLAVPLIVGLGECCRLASERLEKDFAHCRALKRQLWEGLREGLGNGVEVNGDFANSLPGTLNVSFSGVEGEGLLMSLSQLALTSGSACQSSQQRASHVLTALGIGEAQVRNSLRFCVGRPTTTEEINLTVRLVTEKVKQLRGLKTANESLNVAGR